MSTKEKLLEQLGANEGTALLLLSAALTCVMAPICEEILFRGFVYSALCNWRGPWPAAILTGLAFGGIHAGSAPAVDLVPLGVLGFGLCLLYRWTGSLYPCIAAHSLNNSLAFGALESWGWQIPLLMAAALALIALLAWGFKRAGVITPPPPPVAAFSRRLDRIGSPPMISSPPASALPPSGPTPVQSAPAPGASAPQSAPIPAHMTLATQGSRGRPTFLLTGERLVVSGVVRPFVAGQQVAVRFERDGRTVATRTVGVLPGSNGTGRFRLGYASRRPGVVSVSGAHAASPQMSAFTGRATGVRFIEADMSQGAQRARGVAAAVEVERSASRGATQRGLRRRNGAGRDRLPQAHRPGARTVHRHQGDALCCAGAPGAFTCATAATAGTSRPISPSRCSPRSNRAAMCERIYTISSGKPSTPTVLGRFRVYLKTPGTNSEGMVDSNYFIRGYAIHGYAEVPDVRRQPRLPARADSRRARDLRVGAGRDAGRRLLLIGLREAALRIRWRVCPGIICASGTRGSIGQSQRLNWGSRDPRLDPQHSREIADAESVDEQRHRGCRCHASPIRWSSPR